MNILELFGDPFGIEARVNASDRQERQWQTANDALAAAGEALAAENYDAAIATALVGLLSLQLSKT